MAHISLLPIFKKLEQALSQEESDVAFYAILNEWLAKMGANQGFNVHAQNFFLGESMAVSVDASGQRTSSLVEAIASLATSRTAGWMPNEQHPSYCININTNWSICFVFPGTPAQLLHNPAAEELLTYSAGLLKMHYQTNWLQKTLQNEREVHKQNEHRLANERDFVQQIIESSPNLIYVKDLSGRIRLNNISAEKLINLARQSNRPQLIDFFRNSQVDLRVAETGSHISIHESYVDETGNTVYLYTSKIPLKRRDGTVDILAISTNITELKRTQQKLMDATMQAERAKAAKDLFLSNMSHEIRTPVNGISGFINLLQDTSLTQEQRNYIDNIRASADNLKVIINDILDISKIESGKLTFEKIGFRPAELVRNVVSSFTIKANEKSLDLILSITESLNELIVLGDPVRLTQVLNNLISNALKFTNEGNVTIKLAAEEQGVTTCINVEVSDTGIGIKAHQLQTIFDRFSQADNSITRKFGGTGLGLSISKQLIELQGGDIEVESTEAGGSRFKFTIPYKQGTPQDLAELANLKVTNEMGIKYLQGKKVLLVEDNSINQTLALNILSKWHVQTDVAENGLIAVEKLRKNNYDLILMDIQMPIMDGYQTTRIIRQEMPEPKSNIPIMALTANAIKGYEEECLQAGMNAYISKPFTRENLFVKLLLMLNVSIDEAQLVPVESGYTYFTPELLPTLNSGAPPATQQTNVMTQSLIDLSYLTQFSGGDNGFIKEMINLFLERCPIELPKMHEAAEKEDWPAVKALVHKFKPSVSFMGIDSLKDVVLQCEEEAAQGTNAALIKELLQKIDTVSTQACDELRQKLTELD